MRKEEKAEGTRKTYGKFEEAEIMSEETAAVCGNCGEATTGRIYHPYLCADCKVSELLAENAKLAETEEELAKYMEMYRSESEKSTEYFAYKQAFRVMLKELTK